MKGQYIAGATGGSFDGADCRRSNGAAGKTGTSQDGKTTESQSYGAYGADKSKQQRFVPGET